jgi:hypothetical protein
MRTTTAFFAGIGTVVAAITVGLGGGLLLGDIMSPQQPKHQSSEVTRLEQRSAQAPIPAANSASQPVPYLTSPQVAAAVAEPSQPAPQQQPQAAVQPADTKQADTSKTPPANPQPVASVEPAAGKERAAPDDAFAKTRDADIRRESRRAEDRRSRAERHQQWAERKRMKVRERDGDDLRDVEASVRQATEQRPLFGEPRFGSRVGLFEQD